MKFAYLIMAHHRFDVLKRLLQDLDDARNSIFLHIDKKTKNVPWNELKKELKNAELIIIPRLSIYWGGDSQINCILRLLREATTHDIYDYYHFLVGVEFPLKSQNIIHQFFEDNNGYEFIGYDNKNNFADRLQYYRFGAKYARSKKKIECLICRLDDKFLKFQKKINVNRLKHDAEYYKKGYANWSITDKCARYIVSNRKSLMRMCKYSFCADEVFIHTLLYHSAFKDSVYDIEHEYKSAMRLTTWDNKFNRLSLADLPVLLTSDALFARKFDGEDAIPLIDAIIKNRNE